MTTELSFFVFLFLYFLDIFYPYPEKWNSMFFFYETIKVSYASNLWMEILKVQIKFENKTQTNKQNKNKNKTKKQKKERKKNFATLLSIFIALLSDRHDAQQ